MATLEQPAKPKWMTDDFLKTSIRNLKEFSIATELEIENVALSYAVPKGNNFLSIMLRAVVKYRINSLEANLDQYSKSQDVSLIIKISHESEETVGLPPIIFLREFDMYQNLIPTITEILKSNNIESTLACRCLNTIEDKTPLVLVLDDLKTNGYVMAEKKSGLDVKHCKLVFKKLAQFHAASMLYFHNKKDDFKLEYLKSPIYNFSDENISNGIRSIIIKKLSSLINQMSDTSDKYEKIIKEINLYLEKFEQYKHGENFNIDSKFNALLHGDCWTNNMMFRYLEDGSVDDVIFVDLQGSSYGSVAIDFLYFFFASVTTELRRDGFKYLANFYLQSLVKNLKLIGYTGPIPTQEEFSEELKNQFPTAIVSITLVLPIIMAKWDKKMESREESIAFSKDQMIDLYDQNKNEMYNEIALISLITIEQHGLLDNIK